MVNFLAVLCDGSADKSGMEQDVVYYVASADSETGKPTLAFFKFAAPSENSDPPGLKKEIIVTFKGTPLNLLLRSFSFARPTLKNCSFRITRIAKNVTWATSKTFF